MEPANTPPDPADHPASKLVNEPSKYPGLTEFEEYPGGLFKLGSGGRYVEVVYCPRCGFTMVEFNPLLQLCVPCKHPFAARDKTLREVIDHLNRSLI